MHPAKKKKKKNPRNKILFFTFYIYVPNFRALCPIIFFQNWFGPPKFRLTASHDVGIGDLRDGNECQEKYRKFHLSKRKKKNWSVNSCQLVSELLSIDQWIAVNRSVNCCQSISELSWLSEIKLYFQAVT